MKATLSLPRRATYAEYLEVERDSPRRHELLDGVIVAMAGGLDEHSALAARLAMLVGLQLTPGCRFYSSDQRFWISSNGRGRYADGSVICGRPDHPEHDRQATTNPRIVFEVLSPSSEGDDDGDKRRDFQSLRTLEAYVLVHQDSRCLRVYLRGNDGAWADAQLLHDGEALALPNCRAAIDVAAVYEGIVDAAGRSLL